MPLKNLNNIFGGFDFVYHYFNGDKIHKDLPSYMQNISSNYLNTNFKKASLHLRDLPGHRLENPHLR